MLSFVVQKGRIESGFTDQEVNSRQKSDYKANYFQNSNFIMFCFIDLSGAMRYG